MKKIILYICLLQFCIAIKVSGQKTIVPIIPAPQGLAVNTNTGNLFFQRDEQSIRGFAFRIYQSFYYNAATDTLNYGYGHGWSFYYHTFYKEKADSVIIYYSDAKKDIFLLRNGAYTSPVGVYSLLSKTGTQFTLKTKDGSKYIFADASHKKVTRIEDKNANFVNLTYTNGFPTRIANSSGRSLLLSWQNGLLKEAKDEAQPDKKFTYIYNNVKDLVSVIDPLGGRKNFSYKNHRLTQISNQNNNPVLISYYDNSGKVRQITSCNSEQRFSYLLNPRKTFVTQKTEAGNAVTGYTFDDKQRLTGLTDPEGNQIEFTYDTNSNLTEWKNFKGSVTKYEYDANGNMIKEIDPMGNISEYTYESTFNKLSSFKNKKGVITTFNYNAKGDLLSSIGPNNITESYTYDASGKVLTHKDANNNTNSYQYNSNGDLTTIQYPTGTVQLEYNGSCCNVSKITDPNGSTTEMTYDLLNRLKTEKDKLGNTITYFYDAAGNIIKETDPVGNIKEYSYDALNRLISVKLPVGIWNYAYDGRNNLIRMTDANGHISTYEYDKKNRLKKETDPMGNSTEYLYDLSGNLIQKTEPNHTSINYKYDDLNRLTEKNYNGNSDKLAYDEEGNMVSAFNNNIAYTFEYDDLNRLLKKNIVTWNKSLSYTYDAVGNRKTMRNHDGGLTNYNYDANNRIINLTNPSNLTSTFEYDAGGRIKKQTNGNGTFSTYHYDAGGRLDSLINWKNNTEKISFFYYTFDKFGNRKTMRDKRGLHTYNYDESYRLTSVTYADGTIESFTIDGTGNRTRRMKNSIATNYTYNDADQIQTAGANSFVFDANGNTIKQTGPQAKDFRYDALNRLVEVQLPSSKKVQFQYDPFGEKIAEIDTSGQIIKMLYDEDNLLAEMNNTNITQSLYTVAFGMDTWLSLKKNNSNSFYHKDGLNSTSELTDINKATINQYQYDIYGNLQSSSQSIENQILFIGRFYNKQIDLYDIRERFYTPSVGIFINKDSYEGEINTPLSLNRYTYVQNSPVNYIDKTGNSLTSDIGFFLGGAALTAVLASGATLTFTINAGLGMIQGVYDTYANPQENNQNIACYMYNAGVGGLTGIAPIKGILKRIGGTNNLIRKMGIKVGKGSYVDEGLGKVIEFGISKGISWVGDKLSKLPSFNPCTPQKPDGSQGQIPQTTSETLFQIPIIGAFDPNEIIGPSGYLQVIGRDSLKWVSGKKTLSYKVLFENDPDFATAPAQNVTVYVPIHAKLNPASLRISDFGFGNFNFTVPENTSIYTNRLDLRDSLGLYVDVTAGLDIANRRAFWVFQSIDPATGLTSTLPADVGFLPVNDFLTHNGEGYVTFTLLPMATVQTRDSISARGSIIFDIEETILTNTWLNIVDAGAPTSTVTTVTAIDGNSARVKWTGQDNANGMGIAYYDLYVSKDSGPFQLYQANIDTTTFDFNGASGSSYKFFTIATDLVGNKEALKTSANHTIFLGVPAPTLATNRSTACTGQNVILTASNCAGLINWSNGQSGSSITVSITANAAFTANCIIGQVTSNESDSLKIIFGGAIPTATLTGTKTINNGQSANLTTTITGKAPWSMIVGGQTYSGINTSPYTITVSPTATKTYTLTKVTNACGSFDVSTNNSATITVLTPGITTTALVTKTYCKGTSFSINFTAVGIYATGNIFTAQLSNASGSFSTGTTSIGTLTGTSSGAIPVTIPANQAAGSAYRIRVIASNPVVTGTDNGANFTIIDKPGATLTGTKTIIPGQSTNLTVNLTGVSPWSIVVNGQTYANITASPYTINVKPTVTTIYTLTSVTNSCGTQPITSGNQAIITVACGNADLVVSAIDITRYTTNRVYYTAQIKNIGGLNADMGTFFLGVYTSNNDMTNTTDVWKYSVTTGGGTLTPGQTLNFSYSSDFSFTNTQYYLKMKADDLGLISECNEANNTFTKLVVKCSTSGDLNLTGNITSGIYATNQAVTIANATFNNYVLVVGRSITGAPVIHAQNARFIIGNCLNASINGVNTIGNSLNAESEVEFMDTTIGEVSYHLKDDMPVSIYLWNATSKTRVVNIQDKLKTSKGLNTIDLSNYHLNATDTYILNIETPSGLYAKVVE